MTYARRTDTSQQAIVATARAVGAKVLVLNECIDLLLLFRGIVYTVDTKSKGGRLTARQQQLVEDGWPLHFPRSPSEMLAILGVEVANVDR